MPSWASPIRQPLRAVATATALVAVCVVAACARPAPEAEARTVLDGYRQIAHAVYADSLTAVVHLQKAVEQLRQQPSAAALAAAQSSWRAARVPYSHSEALRFGNWFIDEADGQINPWPVDEGFLDYVADDYAASPTNPQARLNLIAAPDRLLLAGQPFATTPMQRIVLKGAQQASDVESNIATGYHAIEFLLWGQDRSATGPGARPWTDYALSAADCTDGLKAAPLRHCQRRGLALAAAAAILHQDLERLAAQWSAMPGSYGDRLVRGDINTGLRRMIFGLATMSGEELAGERIQVALLSGAQEDEQDCFSDDSHHSLHHNGQGIRAFYQGRYGSLQLPSLAALARHREPALAAQLDAAFAASDAALQAIRSAGESGETFDRLIDPAHPQGTALLQAAVGALQTQAVLLEQLGHALQLGPLNPRAQQP